jgi:hypothetical protein
MYLPRFHTGNIFPSWTVVVWRHHVYAREFHLSSCNSAWYAIDSKDVALQRTSTENCKQIFPEKALRSHNTNFHIHVSVSDLFISTIDLPILLQEICGPILVVY